MFTRWMAISILILACVAPSIASAGAPTSAAVVYVRKNCTGIANCFTSLSHQPWPAPNPYNPDCLTLDKLANWIKHCKVPTQANPLLVDIGPGDFPGFTCFGWGHVTFRGSGRDQTRIITPDTSGPNTNILRTAVWGRTDPFSGAPCNDLAFQDLTISDVGENPSGPGLYSVIWDNAGTSYWTNVEMIAQVTWYDGCPETATDPNNRAHHDFYSSSAFGKPSQASSFKVACSQLWWYGGEISAIGDPSSTDWPGAAIGVSVAGTGELNVFGSPIRVVIAGTTSLSP